MNKDYLINTKRCLRREGLGAASDSREDHRRREDGPTAGTPTSQCPPLSSLPLIPPQAHWPKHVSFSFCQVMVSVYP